MLTCCPACRTCFRITEAQLAVAQGKVRCGKCKTVFNAKQHLQPLPGQSSSTSSTTPQPAPEASTEDREQTDHIDLFRAPQSEAPSPPPGHDEATDPVATETQPKAGAYAGLSGTTTEVPFDSDAVPKASAGEQKPPLETKPEPQTVETPGPAGARQANASSESHHDTDPGNETRATEPPDDTPAPETGSVLPATTAEPAGTPAEIPSGTDAMPEASASEQKRSGETEQEPQTLEIPMPDREEMKTAPSTESSGNPAHGSEPEDADATSVFDDSRYRYNDFTDEMLSDRELDDILAEMDQQLSLGIDNPDTELPGSLALPDEPPPPEQDELGEAIDSLFDDLQREPSADDEAPASSASETTEETGPVTTEPQQDPMSLAFDEDFTDRETGRIDEPDRDEWTDTTELSPTTDEEAEAEPVPLRLRDSLAIEPPKPRSWLATLGGGLLLLLLLALLLGQLALFRPLDVIRYVPQSQPWLEQFCQQLPCRFTAYRDTDHIRLLNRDVRAHPNQDDALLISATLVNEANVAQAYPTVRVKLFDLSGNRVAQRRFTPADYLGERHSPFMQMQPETPLQIKLEVADPGSDAVNFEFDFQ